MSPADGLFAWTITMCILIIVLPIVAIFQFKQSKPTTSRATYFWICFILLMPIVGSIISLITNAKSRASN